MTSNETTGDAGNGDTSARAYLILGASGGIGSALARRLAADGGTLMLVGRREEPLAALASELGAHYATADVTDFAEVDRVADLGHAMIGRLDGVANCVGSLILKPAHLTKAEEFQATIAANLTTAFGTVRSAGRVMTNGGSVVLCSSAVQLCCSAHRSRQS